MNRNIKGGFLTLSGVVGIVGMIIVAMQNPATAWVTPLGRMIVSILENGVLIPTVLFLVLFIYGLYILLTEKKDWAIPVFETEKSEFTGIDTLLEWNQEQDENIDFSMDYNTFCR